MKLFIILAIVMVLVIARRLVMPKLAARRRGRAPNLQPVKHRAFFTVAVFSRLNTKRFFRDRLALFFGILFPLIFLFVFGSISGGGSRTNRVSFRVAVLNQSSSSIARQLDSKLLSDKTFKVDQAVTGLSSAEATLSRNQIDAIIVLPPDFGNSKTGQNYPSGEAKVLYSQNSASAGQTLTTVLQGEFKQLNTKFVSLQEPFTASGQQLNKNSLTQFDYTFSGLLGFSIIGLGIFGPVNVFPELKKQGILRRLHTTPLKVWQYFLSTMISQAIIGLVSLAIMFAVAIAVFHLKVVGNYLEIVPFLILSIVTILGVGLAIGGWAKNERQAAPLANIVVFPMMFLSGTFFPRFLMPQWLQGITYYLPLTPVIDGVRLIVTEGKHLTDIGPQLLLIGGWLLVIYIIAFRVFRWE